MSFRTTSIYNLCHYSPSFLSPQYYQLPTELCQPRNFLPQSEESLGPRRGEQPFLFSALLVLEPCLLLQSRLQIQNFEVSKVFAACPRVQCSICHKRTEIFLMAGQLGPNPSWGFQALTGWFITVINRSVSHRDVNTWDCRMKICDHL